MDFNQISYAAESNIRIDSDGTIDPNGLFTRTTEIGPYPDSTLDDNPYLVKVKVSISRVKVNIDGSIYDSEGKLVLLGAPIVMETIFADVE